MSFTLGDLGELSTLATALGLSDDNIGDWLSAPGDHLKTMLADKTQRDALVDFVDTALGGDERRSDSDGRVWLPLFSTPDGAVEVLVIVDDRDTGFVGIGFGATFSTAGPDSTTSLHVPLFRATKSGRPHVDPLWLGHNGAVITIDASVTVDRSAPTAGEAHLGAVTLALGIPTDGTAPTFGLTLSALQLPGATSPSDLSLSLADLDALEDVAFDTVLGLAQAAAHGLPDGPLTGLVGILGLGDGTGVPAFPLHDLADRGVAALQSWFADVASDDSSRGAWLTQLAHLLGLAPSAASSTGVTLTIGVASIVLGLSSAPSAGALPVVVPTVAIAVDAIAGARVRAEADLLRIDLGTGAVVGLPRLAVYLHAGKDGSSGSPLLGGDPAVDAVRAGLSLDANRRAVFVLAADGVQIGSHRYETLDLSTPEALADSLATALDAVVDDLLAKLGGFGDVARTLLGLRAPTSDPTVPLVAVADFLRDPLTTIRAHWQTVLGAHQAAVPELLGMLRDAVADNSTAASLIDGSGSDTDPWRMPIVGTVELVVRTRSAGAAVDIGLAAGLADASLGQGCTKVGTAVEVGLASLDLAAGRASFAPSASAVLTVRARGAAQAVLSLGPFAVTADHVGLRLDWRAGAGLSAGVSAPNLAVTAGTIAIPIAVPVFAADGAVTLDADGWRDVERLLALLATTADVAWLTHLVELFGWVLDDVDAPGYHLSLATVASDPTAALRDWIVGLLLDAAGPARSLLDSLARLVSGSSAVRGRIDGVGTFEDPWRIALATSGVAPELVAWLVPDGPARPLSRVSDALMIWRPGMDGLAPAVLAASLEAEATVADDVYGLVAGRPAIEAGLVALATRWAASDGLIVPPASDPPDVVVHRIADVAVTAVPAAVDLDDLFDTPPDTIIRVAVADPTDDPWPDAPADHLIDLRAPGLAPEAFAVPSGATGEWFVALARRAVIVGAADADGSIGQTARLTRALGEIAATAGTTVLVADARGGHASLGAAAALAGIDVVITAGTPLGPVSFTVLDNQPEADALRLLRWLLPEVDPDEADDPDLGTARAAIGALLALAGTPDPGFDLRPPVAGIAPTRAGLVHHAYFGQLSTAAVSRAMTAVVAAGLARRARARADEPAASPGPSGIRFGVRLPVDAPATGLGVGGTVVVELGGIDAALRGETPVASVVTDRAVHARVELRRGGGWLVGGPGSGGVDPVIELRWLEALASFPLRTSATEAPPAPDVQLVLHEPAVYGIARERWIVHPSALGAVGDSVVTTALPEVRTLLATVADVLGAASIPPAVAPFVAALEALALLAPQGGSVADAVDHLLFDPAAHVAQMLADAVRRDAFGSAVSTLLGAFAPLTIDLPNRTLVIDTSGAPSGGLGAVAWSLHAEVRAAGSAAVTLELGTPAAPGPAGPITGAATLHLTASTGAGPAATLAWRPTASSNERTVALWPSLDTTAVLDAVARLAPAELARQALDAMRSLDATARPFVDAALDALGLLGAAGADGARPLRLPLGLVTDPFGWLGHAAAVGGAGGFDATRVVALLDALKPIVGASGAPGTWELGTGVTITAAPQDGSVRLALELDTGGLEAIPAAPGRVVTGVAVGIALPSGRAPQATAELSLGLAGSAPGRQAVHVVVAPSATTPLSVFVRPATGSDLPLYPNPPGLGQLVDLVTTQALPAVLDAIAGETGNDLAGKAGAVVRAVGGALGLRTSAPAFDGDRLRAWATDPAGSLVAALPSLGATAVQALADALAPLLPVSATAAKTASGGLAIAVHDVTVTWEPSPFAITVAVAAGSVPTIGSLAVGVGLDVSGLKALTATVGPAAIAMAGGELRPYVDIAVGRAPSGGRHVELGLAASGTNATLVGARWSLDAARVDAVTVSSGLVSTDAAAVVATLLEVLLDLVAGFALAAQEVQDLLDGTPIGSGTVRDLLKGVLVDRADPTRLVADLFSPSELVTRVKELASNVASLDPGVEIAPGLRLGIGSAGSVLQLVLELTGRVVIAPGDPQISLEADSRWIEGGPPAGLALDLVDLGPPTLAFTPGIEVNGIGIRVEKPAAPLLELGPVTLGSIAVHTFASIALGRELAGGVQLQLTDLAVQLASAQGGSTVARGIMADAGSGPDKLAPGFSPAVAVQKHGNGPVLVSLSAGEGSGPWWLSIQKGFGPVYIEQVGFGVTVEQEQLRQISLLLDGRVSLFGLSAAVDDLQLTYSVGQPFLEPSSWAVDVAGFAVSADLSGITLAGGLRKFVEPGSTRYVGMLLGRFSTYGLSVFGGYASTETAPGQSFTSFFVFGAVNGPFGGPPAFFLTGIGGGFGINYGLVIPTDLSRFGEFPFLAALDPAYTPPANPLDQITALSALFPVKQGEYWIAAGISFTSFALVDGIAVIAVSFGDGFEISLLGLARLALPRPQFPLVSIELALLARFSTKEGVLWIQAQLTDNSWLLNESVRLTGGFAFVTWFAGPNKGQTVVTLGGYHPNFSRAGYPVVPRLGFNWSVSNAIVIKGESYFALTSEAVMAGGKLEASATFGPAWAHVVFGADGIVYFEPFRYEIDVYARISAGITIDVWIGEITISISIGASLHLEGPDFHGVASFEVGPVSLSVPFGSTNQSPKVLLSWPDFVAKYLEEASSGVARVLSAVTGKGALPAGTTPGGDAKDTAVPDGSAAKPYIVYSEFELTIVSTVPTRFVQIGTAGAVDHTPSRALGIAPTGASSTSTTLSMSLKAIDPASTVEHLNALVADVRRTGAYPIGVWGPPQDDDDRKVPTGDVITAVDTVRFEAVASLTGTLPSEIAYNRLDPPGPRKPLPFVQAAASRTGTLHRAGQVAAVLPDGSTSALVYAEARRWLGAGGLSAVSLAGLERDRTAPPRLGSLTEGLASDDLGRVEIGTIAITPPSPVDTFVHPPVAIGILTSPTLPEKVAPKTTVVQSDLARVTAPTMEAVRATSPLAAPLQLVLVPTAVTAMKTTVVPNGSVPATAAARVAASAVAGRSAPSDGQRRLAGLTASLGGVVGVFAPRSGDAAPELPRRGRKAAALAAAARADTTSLAAGEIAVLRLPNAARDMAVAGRPRLVATGSARLVALGHGGDVLADEPGTGAGTPVPIGTERLAVLATGERLGGAPGLDGWHAGQQLAFVGLSTAIGAGCVVRGEGASIRSTRLRFRAGWARAAELVTGTTIVRTRFAAPVTTIAIVVDDPIGTLAPRGLSLALDGATRAAGADGRALPPSIIASGNRSVLVYALAPGGAGPVTISVASEDGWHLSGVLGAVGAVGEVVDRVSRLGLDAVLRPVVASRTGTVTLAWRAATVPAVTKKAAKKVVRKVAPAKKTTSKKKAAPVAKKRAAARGAQRRRRG